MMEEKELKELLTKARLVYKNRWLGYNQWFERWLVYDGFPDEMASIEARKYIGDDFCKALNALMEE